MKKTDSPTETRRVSGSGVVRSALLFGLIAALCAAFAGTLWDVVRLAMGQSLYSHIPLVPPICVYLAYTSRRDWLKVGTRTDPAFAAGPALASLATLLLHWGLSAQPWVLHPRDALALRLFALFSGVLAVFALVQGRDRFRALVFPLLFLVFVVPMPVMFEEWFENILLWGTAEALPGMLVLTRTPFLRDGMSFAMPGLTIRVAPECSGIRSSFVLAMVGLLAGHMLLRTTWRRVFLAFLFYPVGIVRNAFRILVISLLTIHVDPGAIDGPFHHRGGPIFFALSLVPFFLILLWLARSESRSRQTLAITNNTGSSTP